MVMAIKNGKLIFRKMERDLEKLSSAADAENVHRFRTTTRRMQTLLEDLAPVGDRKQKKLLKLLNRIRRRAGKVRDIDVQLAALRSLKVTQEPRRKTQLVQVLLETRARHEEKLHKLLKKHDFRDIHQRLRRTEKATDFDSLHDPLSVARGILKSAAPADGLIGEEALHRYRLAVKRARYAAEFSPNSVETQQFIAQLKKVQDVLGSWHDWLTLTDSAVRQFGEVNQSSLVAVLHNLTRGKFRNAVSAISQLRPANEPSGSARATAEVPRKSSAKGATIPGRTITAA